MARPASGPAARRREGLVGYRQDNGRVTMVAVGCETDPVSQARDFQEFAKKVLFSRGREGPRGCRRRSKPSASSSSPSCGENILVPGAERFQAGDGEVLGAYAHPPANKIGVLVNSRAARPSSRASLRCTSPSPILRGRRRKTHLSKPSRPSARSTSTRTSFRASRSRRRRRSSRACSRSGSSRAARRCLTEQPWIHDTSQTVGQALEQAGADRGGVQAADCRR